MRGLIVLLASSLLISGCARLERVGKAPDFSDMVVGEHGEGGPRRISLPMPDETGQQRGYASLWQTGEREFFADVRAKKIGDIVTVLINIDDGAQLQNTSERRRENSEDASLDAAFGMKQVVEDAISELDLDEGASLGSSSLSRGSGDINRKEQINLRIAAVVTDVLPNGNLAIAGRQEVLVNYEMRDLRVTGVIRPIDINAQNQIEYKDVAEARVAYGGRGIISDVQQPRYGQQVYDILMPW